MNSYQSGKLAEFIARIYMIFHGYRIVSKNYITGRGLSAGEIDFIARKHNLLVFVEVKQRTTIDTAAYSITSKQQHRIIAGAKSFLQHNSQYTSFDKRFDAILIVLPFKIIHLSNAWQA